MEIIKEKYKRKISWSVVGNLIYALSQWAVVTIIARVGSFQDIGSYALSLAVTAPIILFFNFQYNAILATDSKEEYTFSQYFGSRIINSSIALIIIILVSLSYKDNSEVMVLIILMGFVKYFESLSDLCFGFFQKNNRIDLMGKSQFYRGILNVLIVGILFILTKSVIISVIGLLLLMLFRLISYDLSNVKKYTTITPDFKFNWIVLIKMTYPLGFVSLINSLNTNIPRYFLEYFSDINEVGIYSALAYILTASNLMITPLSLLIAPQLAKAYELNNAMRVKKINFFVILITIVIFVLIFTLIVLFDKEILSLLYGEDYIYYSDMFVLINISIIFSALTTLFNLNIVAARVFRVQPILNFLVVVISAIASLYFIPSMGVLGAIYVLLTSKIVQMLFSALLMIYGVSKIKVQE